MFATGTAPPAVTISSAPATPTGLWIDIQTGGALGVATFKFSTNDGSSYGADITTGASVNLGNGFVISFANATYNADNLYKATVASWTGTMNGYVLSQGTAANQPVYSSVGWNGASSLVFASSRSTVMINTDGALVTPFNGDDTNCAMLIGHDCHVATSGPGGLFGADNSNRAFLFINTTTIYPRYGRSTLSLAASAAASGRRHQLGFNVGTAGSLYRNGVLEASGTLNAASMTLTNFAIGASRSGSTSSNFLTGNIGPVLLGSACSNPAGLSTFLASLGWDYV